MRSRDVCSFYFSTRSLFQNDHALVLISQLWRTLKDSRSQINIWLEHLTNSLVETIAVSESSGVLCNISRADKTSREPCDSWSSATILEYGEQFLVHRALWLRDHYNVWKPSLP